MCKILMRSKFFIILGIQFGLLMPASTMAQLEEVIVTAQKRAESIQDVPIAINALTGDMLDDRGIQSTADIENVFPGLTTNNASAANAGFAIRGVGTSSFHISGQQSVGIYIDNIYQVSPFTSTIGVFDMERVEVVRGPQNTLYGRNTTGGAVNFHTRSAKVGEGTNGFGRVTAGNGERYDFEGALGGDLGDTVAGRIAFSSNNFDGVLDSANTGEAVDSKESLAVRAGLIWDVSDDTTFELKFTHGEAEGDDQPQITDGNLGPGGTGTACSTFNNFASNPGANDCTISITGAQIAASPYLSGLGLAPDPGRAGRFLFNGNGELFDDVGHGYDISYDILNAYITHDFDSFELYSATSYLTQEIESSGTGDVVGFTSNQAGEWDVFQQEFRLTSNGDGPLRWIAGLYYTSQESEQDTWALVAPIPPPGGLTPGIIIDSEYDAYSVYGQIDYDFAEDLTLTLGARFTDDELAASRYERWQCGPIPSPFGGAPGVSVDNTIRFDRDYRFANCGQTPLAVTSNPKQELSEVGYNARISWKATDDVLLFASFGSGFKGGAYDNRALADGSNPIDPEFLDAWEIGMKGTFADGKVQLNVGGYFYIWEDIQLFEIIGGIPALNNIPELELMGLEAELSWAPNEAFFLQVAFNASENEITDISGLSPTTTAREGNEKQNTPDFSGNVLATYTWPVENGEVTLMGSYRYLGSHVTDLDNAPRNTMDARNLLNARVTYNFGSEMQHSVALFGNNLTGELECQTMNNGAGVLQDFGCVVDPSYNGDTMWGVTLETNF